jgi:hypothetical protein
MSEIIEKLFIRLAPFVEHGAQVIKRLAAIVQGHHLDAHGLQAAGHLRATIESSTVSTRRSRQLGDVVFHHAAGYFSDDGDISVSTFSTSMISTRRSSVRVTAVR